MEGEQGLSRVMEVKNSKGQSVSLLCGQLCLSADSCRARLLSSHRDWGTGAWSSGGGTNSTLSGSLEGHSQGAGSSGDVTLSC